MSTKETLESSLKNAMRAQDDLRKRTLRMALASIRNLEIDRGAALDEPAVLAILQKEIKSRQESLAEARRAGRADLEAAVTAEIGVLEEFLPQPLSAAALEDLAQQAIAEVGATSQRDMGKVMKVLMPRLQGRAAGDQASQVVRRLLE
jgi:uncharacterized protein YqeY